MNSIIKLDETRLNEYYVQARDYCLVNGLVTFPHTPTDLNCVVNLPITLLPTQFSSKNFKYACDIQKHFNELMHKVGNDKEFLRKSLRQIIEADEFTRRLWEIYEKVTHEGIAQTISFAIIRSDYMIDSNKFSNEHTQLSQIEINTVASSFGAATSRISDLHAYMFKQTNNEQFLLKQPKNNNIQVLAQGFIDAWKAYDNEKALIMFIVNEAEKNIGDQRLLEYEILKNESRIRIIRKSLEQVYNEACLNTNKCLIIDSIEIAVVYYRDGYDPDHYKQEQDWNARLLLERSKAIKCPSIQHHLAGAKKIQQELSNPGVLERFIGKKEAELLRETFVEQYSFDFVEKYDESKRIVMMMIENSNDYVLKPQREGGGNNIYGENIKDFVKNLQSLSELNSFILMKLIKPITRQNYLIKNGSMQVKQESVVSELGIYGVVIGDSSNNILSNTTGSYLLRSKCIGTNEGGVAAGFSVLDTIYLD